MLEKRTCDANSLYSCIRCRSTSQSSFPGHSVSHNALKFVLGDILQGWPSKGGYNSMDHQCCYSTEHITIKDRISSHPPFFMSMCGREPYVAVVNFERMQFLLSGVVGKAVLGLHNRHSGIHLWFDCGQIPCGSTARPSYVGYWVCYSQCFKLTLGSFWKADLIMEISSSIDKHIDAKEYMAIRNHTSMVITIYMQALTKQTSMCEVQYFAWSCQQYLNAGLVFVVFIPGKVFGWAELHLKWNLMGVFFAKWHGVRLVPHNLWEIHQVVWWVMAIFLQSFPFQAVKTRSCGSRSIGSA